jgi:signal transduction histidine kinase
MQDVVPISPPAGRNGDRWSLVRLAEYLPRGNTLDPRAWRRRHRLLQWVLLLHVPGLIGLGLLLEHPVGVVGEAVALPVSCLVVGHLVTHRRWASFFVTVGLVFCSAALVLLSRGSIEAHFHFFIIIGFIALYQDWVPFLWNVAFTTLSHGIGTIWLGGQIFNHPAAQQDPWLWSVIHGVAVLLACIGMVIFWRITEDEQNEKEALGRRLLTADAEINRRQFTSDMLVNLARRNQSMLYRQLDIINQLEDKERDPDALADLFKLDHLATRVRRNAESLLVLAGEHTPRTWSAPVALRDVVRAAIAETEDLDRVVFAVDDRAAVSGGAVADLTHLLAELTENAVRFSPPETAVTIRARPNRRDEGGQLLTVEDWGVGMPPDDLAEANDLLANPREVDLAVSQRLGFHVVARLAARHGIAVSLSATPGSGITAVVVIPAALFAPGAVDDLVSPVPVPGGARPIGPVPPRVRERGAADAMAAEVEAPRRAAPGLAVTRNGDTWLPPEPFTAVSGADSGPTGPEGRWHGWWSPEVHGATGAGLPAFPAVDPADGRGPGGNGHGANGSGANGHGANGSGSNGSGGNGHGGNGHGGHTAVRPAGTNGAATDGTDAAGANGAGADGAPGARPDGRPADEPATVVLAPGTTGGTDGSPGEGTANGIGDRDGAAGTGPDTGPPGPAVPRPAPPSARGALRLSDAREVLERARPADGTGPRPLSTVVDAPSADATGTALPHPRPDEPWVPTPLPRPRPDQARSTHGGPTGRGLRRRVPQSHLAPELRHRTHGGLAETATPLSADAAATALSRYQASRLAAQAVVDTPGRSGPAEGGERA